MTSSIYETAAPLQAVLGKLEMLLTQLGKQNVLRSVAAAFGQWRSLKNATMKDAPAPLVEVVVVTTPGSNSAKRKYSDIVLPCSKRSRRPVCLQCHDDLDSLSIYCLPCFLDNNISS